MDRYREAFGHLRARREGAFVPFVVLGDPDPVSSLRIVQTLIESGADMLELGIPFSDPIADGPTIQWANLRAFEAHMNTEIAFEMLSAIREMAPEIPVGLLLYANLIYGFGAERFCKALIRAGVDSILVADCPLEEQHELQEITTNSETERVQLISLNSDGARLNEILRIPSPFYYVTAVSGVTGARSQVQEELLGRITEIRVLTESPLCAGFGISKPQHIKPILERGADGVICGSAIIKLIQEHLSDQSHMLEEIGRFALTMKAQTQHPPHKSQRAYSSP